MRFEDWPRLGAVDLALTWEQEQPVLLELKCGRDKWALDACAWDAIKCAFALARGIGAAAYLLAATTRANWMKPIRGVELFDSGEFEANDLRDEYDDAFLRWENDGYPVGSDVPRRLRTSAVASVPITVGDVDWDLRLSRVEPLGDDWFAWAPLAHASLPN